LPNLKAHHKYKLSTRERDAHFVAAEFATFVSRSGMFTECFSTLVRAEYQEACCVFELLQFGEIFLDDYFHKNISNIC